MYGCEIYGDLPYGDILIEGNDVGIIESSESAESLQILIERRQKLSSIFGDECYGDGVYGDAYVLGIFEEQSPLEEKSFSQESLAVQLTPATMHEITESAESLTCKQISGALEKSESAESLDIAEGFWFSESSESAESLTVEAFRFRPGEREINRLHLIWLIDIQLKNSGPLLHLSDAFRTLDDGTIYEAYLDDLSGLADEIKRASAEGRNADVTLNFRNLAVEDKNYLSELGRTYPFAGAEVTIRECYLFDDNSIMNVATLFKGVLDEPRGIDDLGFTCNCSSKEFYADKTWKNEIIDTVKYPNAYEDVGKVEPIVYGADVRIPALRTDWGAKTTLKTSINATQLTSIELSDSSRFPFSGSLYIDDELILYTAIYSNVLSGVTRPTPTSHRAGAEAWEQKSIYKSLLARHLLYDVGDIFAEVSGKLLRVTEGVSVVEDNGKTYLYASEQIRVKEVEDEIDVADTIGVNDAIGVADNINFIGSATTRTVYPNSGQAAAIDGNNNTNWFRSTTGLSDINSGAFGFPADNLGSIIRQFITVTMSISGGSVFIGGGWAPSTIGTGGGIYRLQKQGGNWSDSVSFSIPGMGTPISLTITEVVKEVEYYPAMIKSGAAYRSGGATKTGMATKEGEVVVSTKSVDRFHAVCSGHKDPDGNYGGQGTLIERPDWVQKHWLINYMGFSLSEINTNNWNIAGAWYQANGYNFAFALLDKITPSDLRRRMDFESRTNGFYKGGKWYLKVIPDTAPTEKKTIAKVDLAGQYAKFKFDEGKWIDIANDLTLKYNRNYSRIGSESEWDGTLLATDATSKTKYGTYPKEFQFALLRDTATATSVLAHLLLELKFPPLIARFPVFWENFDLIVGDTILTGQCFEKTSAYDGLKFYVENVRRIDKKSIEITAVEWWA